MADPLRHRQTKGAATDMVDLTPPRHIPTLPNPAIRPKTQRTVARSSLLALSHKTDGFLAAEVAKRTARGR
jgi:hypothetical protein